MASGGDTNDSACMYKKCDKKEDKLTPSSARVEVKSFVPDRETDRSCFCISWRRDGQAMFHGDCWRTLMKAYKTVGTDIPSEEQEMLKEALKTAEYFDSMEDVKKEGKRLARMIKASSHAIVFTGAGISTSAGIGDFRGKSGAWTERDRAKKYGAGISTSAGIGAFRGKGGACTERDTAEKYGPTAVLKGPVKRSFRYADLRPTYTHEAIAKLVEIGHVKYVISQNVDGIHRLSDLPRDKISELHGNAFHEKCEKCDARYERTYRVGGKASNVPAKSCSGCNINHRTGRKCERKSCDGYLMNTIINFGDNLETSVLDTAIDHSRKHDLILCLGSSLTVTPASNLVEYGKKPLRVVICNRQPTQYDEMCYKKAEKSSETLGVRVFADCDVFMAEVMKGILSPEVLTDWEEGREQRMVEYAKQRTEPEL